MPLSVARQLEEICIKIGNEVADDDGFTPIRRLLDHFQIVLVTRPLLVEGMLATIEESSEVGVVSRWAVLVDTESSKLRDISVTEESKRHPLPSRLRNTIAHELVHSLIFRPTEFGLQLDIAQKDKSPPAKLVELIERETERLSPLLLFSEKALRQLLASKLEALSVEELAVTCRDLGISRYLLIGRLRLLRSNDSNGFLEYKALRNIAIGLAEWIGDIAAIRSWPLFINFDRNVVPDFLLSALGQDRVTAKALGIPASSALCGGSESSITFECEGKVKFVAKGERMTVMCSIERKNRGSGQFLFVIRRVAEKVTDIFSTDNFPALPKGDDL